MEGGANNSCIRGSGVSDVVDAWMAGRREHGVACPCGGSGTEYSFIFVSRNAKFFSLSCMSLNNGK